LEELKDHRRLFYEAHPPSNKPWTAALTALLPHGQETRAHAEANLKHDLKYAKGKSKSRSRSRELRNRFFSRSPPRKAEGSRSRSRGPFGLPFMREEREERAGTQGEGASREESEIIGKSVGAGGLHLLLPSMGAGSGSDAKGKGRERYDPDEYTHAKKKLKKAVLEHYRGLEVLGDYRVRCACRACVASRKRTC
jgi:hypothetical protein